MFKSKKKFLEDLIKYYDEDPKRRCTEEGNCKYSSQSTNQEGVSEGCAIGRHLDPKVAFEIDNKYNDIDIETLFNNEELKKFPKWLVNLGVDFLTHCQLLHDKKEYWAEKGLSDLGKRKVELIRHKFKLSKINI